MSDAEHTAPEGAEEAQSGTWLDLDSTGLAQPDESQHHEFLQETGAYSDSSYARVRSRAEKGDVEAQFELCMRYHDGHGGVLQDDEASYRWCYEAAKQGHAWALANLGWMYESGTGVASDHSKAADAYRAAAEKGLPEAMVWFGQMLEQGRGVEENPSAAFEWYSRAAEAGDANGQYNVALCYQFGKGVEKDENIAFTWYEKAGEQQHVDALYNLGWLYSQGRGVAKDTRRAKELFTIAAGSSDEADELIIEAMDYDQGRGGVNKDPAKSHSLYLQAARKGSVTAMFTVGVNYEYGHGVAKNWEEALYWYKKAAAKGHPEAAFRARFRQLAVAGVVIRFFRYSGIVGVGGRNIESGRHHGGMVGRFSNGRQREQRHKRVKSNKFFLDTDLGDKVEVELPRPPDALYCRQRITLIYAIKKGKTTGPYMLMVNHDNNNDSRTITTSRAFWDEEVSGGMYGLGGLLAMATIGLPWLVGSLLPIAPSPSEGVMHAILHPFNWILFLPLLLSFGFWLRSVLGRRNRGIQMVRQRMAEIKSWAQQSALLQQR